MDHLVATYVSTLATLTIALACFTCAGVLALIGSRIPTSRAFGIAFFIASGIHALLLTVVVLFRADTTLMQLTTSWYWLVLRTAMAVFLCGFVMTLFINIDSLRTGALPDDEPADV